jgi:DNA modification methylase
LWADWPGDYPKGGLLFHGDNKEVLAHLLANGFRGKVNLIYIDPPFDSGADYVRKVELRGAKGVAKIDGEAYTLGEQVQYTDIWANDNYLQFMYERLQVLKELLGTKGLIAVHCDAARIHLLRCLMDEVFGDKQFRNEVIWYYENKLGTGGNVFDSRHDSILIYAKGGEWIHNPILIPVKSVKDQPVTQKIDGKRVWLRDENGKRIYQESNSERPLGDVWTIPIINPVSTERSGFPTQKPEQLLFYIISSMCDPQDIVLDSFIGSGTTAALAQKLGRRWIGCDINKGAIQTTAKRLQAVIADQSKAQTAPQQQTLAGMEASDNPPPEPAQLAFTVWRVNDYDLQIQHNEAVNLACDYIGVERKRSDAYFDGILGKRLVKNIPFNHPLSPLDLDELQREFKARPDEDRDVVLVCLGMELAAQSWLEDWNRHRKTGVPNRIEVIELRTDPKYAGFIRHDPAKAKIAIRRQKNTIKVKIEDFISPTIIKRLDLEQSIFKARITDWRSQVDCVMIDTAYDGKVFNVALSDVPAKKSDLVAGEYKLDAPPTSTNVAIKIIDMLGEEVLVIAEA